MLTGLLGKASGKNESPSRKRLPPLLHDQLSCDNELHRVPWQKLLSPLEPAMLGRFIYGELCRGSCIYESGSVKKCGVVWCVCVCVCVCVCDLKLWDWM